MNLWEKSLRVATNVFRVAFWGFVAFVIVAMYQMATSGPAH
jgi:hypothetical protein